jgi:hypothetical protein
MERDESAVIGTARMGKRTVPHIRPFDLVRNTPLTGNRARVTVFEGDALQVATEYMLPGVKPNLLARQIMTSCTCNSAVARRSRARAV